MTAKVALPYSEGKIFPHFGKAVEFRLYTVADGKVASSETARVEGSGHEETALWLVRQGVNAVVCGNIGPGALGALAAAGIFAFAGVEGDADEAVAKLLDGTLQASGSANCAGHSGGGCGGGCGGCHGHGASGCGCHS